MKQKIQLTQTSTFALEMLQFSIAHLAEKFQISSRIIDINIQPPHRWRQLNRLTLRSSGHVHVWTPGANTHRVLSFKSEISTLCNRNIPKAESFSIELNDGREEVYFTIQAFKIENPDAVDRKIVLTGIGVDRPER